jgi:hypothetical protein
MQQEVGSMHERRPMIDVEEFQRRLRRQSSGKETDDDPLAESARLISGQQDSFQRVAEPHQSSTEARQVAASSPEAQETEAQEPDALQSLDDDNMACQDSGTVNEEIALRRSIMAIAAIFIVGMVSIGASFRFRSGASPPPEIATISENGPAKPQLEKTNRPDVPTPDASILGTAPQKPFDPLQPRETMPAAGIAPSPEQIETQVEPPSQTAPIAPEKMNTASVERHDTLLSSDMSPRATTKIVPLPVPRPADVAKALTPKTAARVAMPRSGVRAEFRRGQTLPIVNTAKPKRPASNVTAQPVQATDSQGGGREPDPLGDLVRGLFGYFSPLGDLLRGLFGIWQL